MPTVTGTGSSRVHGPLRLWVPAAIARYAFLLPLLIVAAGLALRIYGYNFDDGQMLQPDELAIDSKVFALGCCLGSSAAATWPSPLTDFFNAGLAPYDPHMFNYGSLPLYLLAFVTRAASWLGTVVPGFSAWRAADADLVHVNWIGRWLSALFDTATLIVLYRLARRVYDPSVALLTLFLGTFTVLEIQLSHFYAVDTVLTFFVILTLWAAVVMVQENKPWAFLAAGASLGAALAVKASATPLVLSIAGAALLPILTELTARYHRLDGSADSGPGPGVGESRRHPGRASHSSAPARLYRVTRGYFADGAPLLNRNLALLLAAFAVTILAFAIFEPYGLIDHAGLLANIQTQNAIIVSHSEPVPFTIQYVGTRPYWYYVRNVVLWDMGIPLGVAAIAGTLWALYENLGIRIRPAQLVVLLWVVPYFIIVGRFWAKFSRYMLPIIPLLTMFGAALLIYLVRKLGPRWRPLTWGLLTIVGAGTFAWALAFMHIYTVPNSQIAASEWIHAHISPTTPFATEGAWDRSLPYCLPQPGQCPGGPGGYNPYQLNLYDPDTQAKVQHIVYALTHDRYIIMSTERFVDSIPREPNVYPITTRYYQLLFHKRLNFRLEKRFAVHPQLGPFTIDDFGADESFHVYDHPDVRIFKRIGPISVARATQLLTTANTTGLSIPEPDALPPRAGRRAALAAHGSAPLPPVNPVSAPSDNRLMLTRHQWAADQTAPTMDHMFPPHGFGMSHPVIVWLFLIELLGLLAFPLTFFLFGALRDRGYIMAKTFGLLVTGWLVWMGVSAGIFRYTRLTIWLAIGLLAIAGAASGWRQWPAIRTFVRYRYRDLAWSEAIFLAGFAAFVLLRMWYPDLGHQFSPVGLTNAGGGRMGEKQMELAFLNAVVRSRTFPPLDPFFAGGYLNYYYFGYVLVGTLCKATTIMPATGFNLAIPMFFGLLVGTAFSVGLNLARSTVSGIVAAVFVGAIGNLNGLVQLVVDLQSVATYHSFLPVVGGLLEVVSGAQQAIFYHHPLPPFDYWASTRLVPPVGGNFAEFPYFTYLFADLHPHLMAFPLTLAALALAVNLMFSVGRLGRRRVLVTVIGGGFLLGAIAATNPWDFPTYLLVLVAGILAGYIVRRRAGGPTIRCRPDTTPGSAIDSAEVRDEVRASGPPSLSPPSVPALRSDTLGFAGITRRPGMAATATAALALPAGRRLWNRCGEVIVSTRHGEPTSPRRVFSAGDLIRTVGWAASFGLVALLLFLRFVLDYHTVFSTGLATVRSAIPAVVAQYQSQTAPTLTPAQVQQQTHDTIVTPLTTYWEIFGLFLFVIVSWLVMLGDPGAILATGVRRQLTAWRFAFYYRDRLRTLQRHFATVRRLRRPSGRREPRLDGTIAIVGVLAAIVLISMTLYLLAFLELLGGITIAILWAQRLRLDERVLFALTLLLIPIAISIFGETLFLKDFLSGGTAFRMNTIAKSYNQVWVLYAIVAAFGLAFLVRGALGQEKPARVATHAPAETKDAQVPEPRIMGSGFRRLPGAVNRHPWWSGAFAILLLGSLIYTYAGTVARETVRQDWLPENSVPLTLNGMAFMRVAYPDDYAGINWLNAHVHGAPPIIEQDGAGYNWRSRVVQFTGLPTLFGGIHEGEQRYGDELGPRQNALETIYGVTGPDVTTGLLQQLNIQNCPTGSAAAARCVALALLHRFDVSYVYVGLMEQQKANVLPDGVAVYWPVGVAKFRHMPQLQAVFHHGRVTIYHVRGTAT